VSLNNQHKYISKTSYVTLHTNLTVVTARYIGKIPFYILQSEEGYSNAGRNV